MRSRGVDSIYSCVVAMSCGLVFSLTSLPMRLGSQIFVSLKDNYGATRDAASLPFELAYFARSISGPLAGYFGQAVGLRKITLIGTIVGTIGLIVCFFANNIAGIDIGLGLIFGVGFGWATAVVPEIINQHFNQHRAKAMGLVFGVSGLSAALSPPLLEFILNKYGESATFLMISGIVLNAIPAAMLLTKPDGLNISTPKRTNFVDNGLKKEERCHSMHASNGIAKKSKKIFTKSDIYSIHTSKSGKNVSKHTAENGFYNSPVSAMTNSISDNNFSQKTSAMNQTQETSTYTRNTNARNTNARNEYDEPNLKLSTLSTEQVPELQMAELNINNLTSRITPKTEENNYFKSNGKTNSVQKIENETSILESFSILWTPKFLTITFIQSSHFYVMYMFWTITIDVVRDKGVGRDTEVYFVMAFSFLDTIGRFFLASVTDCTRITAAHFSSVCFLMMGLACLSLVFVSGFKATFSAICVLGLIVGGNTTSLPGIDTGFIEKDKRPLAMASRLLMYAPMSFTMSPLIGYFREELSSYNGLLYLMTSMCFTCSISLKVLSRLNKCNLK